LLFSSQRSNADIWIPWTGKTEHHLFCGQPGRRAPPRRGPAGSFQSCRECRRALVRVRRAVCSAPLATFRGNLFNSCVDGSCTPSAFWCVLPVSFLFCPMPHGFSCRDLRWNSWTSIFGKYRDFFQMLS
jgi:hypothetical protein